MEAGRQPFRPPHDLADLGKAGASLHDLEQSVTRPDKAAPVGLHENRRPGTADPGIDDAEEYCAGREPGAVGSQQVRGCLRIGGRGDSEEVDDGNAGRHFAQNRLDLPGVGSGQAEVGEEDDQRARWRRYRTSAAAGAACTGAAFPAVPGRARRWALQCHSTLPSSQNSR